jgi:hypothetical protein
MCGTTATNELPSFRNVGVFARWYTEEYKDYTGEGRFQEYDLWCCSIQCAHNAQDPHEGMVSLKKVDL